MFTGAVFRWFRRTLRPLYNEALGEVARLVGAQPGNIVFVQVSITYNTLDNKAGLYLLECDDCCKHGAEEPGPGPGGGLQAEETGHPGAGHHPLKLSLLQRLQQRH